MIRQAHTYLAGAMGGATLIAIAIAVFVVLVSAQVFRDWPLAALGDGGNNAAVAPAQAAAGAGGEKAAFDVSSGSGGRDGVKADRDGGSERAGDRSLAVGGSVDSASGESVTTAPAGPEPDRGQAGGNQAGGNQGAPGASADAPGASTPSATAPGSGSAGTGAGGGKSTAGSEGGGSGGGATTPTGQVTETVNGTVNQVDESALGGTLNNAGVTEATEGVVNGVVGPESTVGKVVDETVGAVGGLLHPSR